MIYLLTLLDFIMNSIFYSLFLLIVLVEIILSRPLMQKIVINNHVWEVPDEPGWEDVIKDAEIVRQQLHKCTTARECLEIIKTMRAVFYYHSVSRQYLEAITDDDDDNDNNKFDSIFKWG